MKERIADIIAFLRRNTLRIVLFLALVAGACVLRACYYAGQVTEVLNTNPPLPKKTVKAIEARAKADSVKVVVYKQKAKVAIRQADSLHHIARQATKQADSIRTQYESLPTVSAATLPELQRKLAGYQEPDTSAY